MQKNNNVSTVIMFNSSNSSLSLSYYVIFVSCANQDILLKLYVKMHYPPSPFSSFSPFLPHHRIWYFGINHAWKKDYKPITLEVLCYIKCS